MICCLHHKRLRETEFTTRYRSFDYISFISSFLFFQFPPIHFWTRVLQALAISRSPATYLNTSTARRKQRRPSGPHPPTKGPRSLTKTAVLSYKSTATSPTSRCRQSHTEAPFLGCPLSLLRSVDPKTSYAKPTRSLSEWQCQSLSAGARWDCRGLYSQGRQWGGRRHRAK